MPEENEEKLCQQIHVPTVDETEYECDECGFTDFKCVKTKVAYEYLGLSEDANLDDVIAAIVSKLTELSNEE